LRLWRANNAPGTAAKKSAVEAVTGFCWKQILILAYKDRGFAIESGHQFSDFV
jgi:hypothetical protein